MNVEGVGGQRRRKGLKEAFSQTGDVERRVWARDLNSFPAKVCGYFTFFY